MDHVPFLAVMTPDPHLHGPGQTLERRNIILKAQNGGKGSK